MYYFLKIFEFEKQSANTNHYNHRVLILSKTLLHQNNKENNETLTVTLSNPSNATISDSTATLTITDDDPDPSITIADVTTSNENAAS